MITTCTGCQARYRLDASKVPNRMVRVRCPECAAVFELDGTLRDEPVIQAPEPIVEPQPQEVVAANPSPPPALEPSMPGLEPAPEPSVSALEPAPAVAGLEPASGAASVDPTPAAAPAPDAPRPARRRRRDKSEMLARALVSDILVYNQDARDQALAEGNLLEALGPEIKKSWELYKEKVGAEEANNTTHFKDALNEILADGQAIF